MPESILLVTHDRDPMDDRASQWAAAQGYALDWRCPADGDSLPKLDDRIAGIVLYGGAQDVDQQERYPFFEREFRLIEDAYKRGTPMLGLCLGGQLMAHVLGEPVHGHEGGHAEYGYYDLIPAEAGRDLFGEGMKVLQSHWHGWYNTPPGAVKLAGTAAFPEQAFRHGENAYGFQFHPETRITGLSRWISRRDSTRHAMKGAHPPERQLADHRIYDAALGRWFETFLGQWLRVPVAA